MPISKASTGSLRAWGPQAMLIRYYKPMMLRTARNITQYFRFTQKKGIREQHVQLCTHPEAPFFRFVILPNVWNSRQTCTTAITRAKRKPTSYDSDRRELLSNSKGRQPAPGSPSHVRPHNCGPPRPEPGPALPKASRPGNPHRRPAEPRGGGQGSAGSSIRCANGDAPWTLSSSPTSWAKLASPGGDARPQPYSLLPPVENRALPPSLPAGPGQCPSPYRRHRPAAAAEHPQREAGKPPTLRLRQARHRPPAAGGAGACRGRAPPHLTRQRQPPATPSEPTAPGEGGAGGGFAEKPAAPSAPAGRPGRAAGRARYLLSGQRRRRLRLFCSSDVKMAARSGAGSPPPQHAPPSRPPPYWLGPQRRALIGRPPAPQLLGEPERAAGAGLGLRKPGQRLTPRGLAVLALQPGRAAHPSRGNRGAWGGWPACFVESGSGKQDRGEKQPLRGSQPPRGTCLSFARRTRDVASTFVRQTPPPQVAPPCALPCPPLALSLMPALCGVGWVFSSCPLTIFGVTPPWLAGRRSHR